MKVELLYSTPDMKATGWDNGLNQDYDKRLARWFSSRLDARAVVRRWCAEGWDG